MKTNADADVEQLIAQLVACRNEKGLKADFFFTFAAVTEMSTVMVVLALAATCGVGAKHEDIPTTSVKGAKEAAIEIILNVPQAMVVFSNALKKLTSGNLSELVLQLCESLQGLRQKGGMCSQVLHTRLLWPSFKQ